MENEQIHPLGMKERLLRGKAMFKIFKKHPPKEGEDREKIKKDLFDFQTCGEHGFPTKPSALAYDPKLKLIAIGTKSGVIRIHGAPGVVFSACHKDDVSVVSLLFLPEQGRLLSICSDNSLHLWELNVRSDVSVLEEVKTFAMENNKMKTISCSCLADDYQGLLLGTEGGNIYVLNVGSFSLSDQVVYQDIVMQNIPDDFKVSPGAVEAIAVRPTYPEQLLIGYNRGLIILWDNNLSQTLHSYNASQQLESLTWSCTGDEFYSAHADGSYMVWDATGSSEQPKVPPVTPYGPFPCKSISKLLWKTAETLTCLRDKVIIFSGGMPRASYGDRHTVTIMQGNDRHVVFDLSSRVVDFVVLTRADEADIDESPAACDEPHTLVLLAEEELLVVDLESEGWPIFRLPYLYSVHSSAVTTCQHVSNVPSQLWQKLVDVGNSQCKKASTREWPISGGKNLSKEPVTKDMLITGHEDGTVYFWDASGSNFLNVYGVATSPIFGYFDHAVGAEMAVDDEEEWPPFRKVGTFDPYSDDPRLAVQKTLLCSLSETLVVAGTAGQLVVLQMEREARTQELQASVIDIVSQRDSFVWKGHSALKPLTGDVRYAAGFQPTCVVQLNPPAACTSLSLHSEWQLVAYGTAHGFGLFDYAQKKQVTFMCTLNISEVVGTSDTAMSRRKSLKKSLRESFRRLRKGRSQRRKSGKLKNNKSASQEAGKSPVKGEGVHAASPPAAVPIPGASATPAFPSPGETRTVERAVEARTGDDSMASMVRTLYFADTFVVNGVGNMPSLWVGTNGGHAYVYTLIVPGSDKRSTDTVSCTLAKEIKLRHRAPIIAFAVTDNRNHILPDPLEVSNERAKAPEMDSHSVLICSEEQLKVFTLPSMKPKWKNKITAVDGTRLRKVVTVNFRSKAGDNYSENNIVCLNNVGDVAVYSVVSLRRQLLSPVVRKEDINAISSFVFTKGGQGYFLQSPSEFCQVSLSAFAACLPECLVELKEGMRPEVVESADDVPALLLAPQVQSEQNSEMAAVHVEAEDGTVRSATCDGADASCSLNDSQTVGVQDTTADITVDSVREHVTNEAMMAGRLSNITSTDGATDSINQTTTMLTTDTTTVTLTSPSPVPLGIGTAEDAGSAANHQADATEPVLNGTDAGVMNGTEDGGASNGMDEPGSPTDELVDKMQGMVTAAGPANDVVNLKKKLAGAAVSNPAPQEAIG